MGSEPPVDNLQIRRMNVRVGLCLDQVVFPFLVRLFVALLLVLKSFLPGFNARESRLSQQLLADFFCIEKLKSYFPGCFGVFRVVAGYLAKALCRFLHGREGKNPSIGWQMTAPACLLNNSRSSSSQVACRSAAEPTSFSFHISVLCNAPFPA